MNEHDNCILPSSHLFLLLHEHRILLGLMVLEARVEVDTDLQTKDILVQVPSNGSLQF